MTNYSELFRAVASAETEPLKNIDEVQEERIMQFTLLFVDDEEGVLNALRRIFLEENYQILLATSAEKALVLMEREKVHLVISDHRMPGMTGAQFLKEIKEKWPETIRIMLTGHADVQSIMGAVKDGAVYKFITKPWNDEDLRLTVSIALQQYMLVHENRKLKEIAKKQQLKIKNYAGLFEKNSSILGKILVKAGVISQDQLESAAKALEDGDFLGDLLVRCGITTEAKIISTLQNQLNVPYLDLKEVVLTTAVVKCLPYDLCTRNRLLPVKLEGNTLTLAMADPSDLVKCDNIAMVTGFRVTPVLSTSSEIIEQLKKVYGENPGNAADDIEELADYEPLDEIDIVIEEEEKDVSIEELIGSSKVPPIIRIVNAIISESIRYRASDIHIESKTKYTVVRFRIDGLLHNKIKVPADLHAAIISRIKILSKMDISERRKPQDGRISVKSGTRMVDIRVSSMPTINGEKVVMRILDKSAAIRKVEELGVLPDDFKKVFTMIKKPQGVIITTGPTGSGKTTMLYSLLNTILESSKNFETIEDPVEYFLEDANQVYVRDKIGLSFAQVLRATLRQDPDVILVGEIRDYETADVAFKASLTGHMVFSTLHTNSSIASITRLIDMGIKPYIIASALEGIMAQRLVRKICDHCRIEIAPDKEYLSLLKIDERRLNGRVFKGKGCERCNQSGYDGRIGIFEVFMMNDDYRHLISGNYKESELLKVARADGMRTLIEDGVEKVRLGGTSLDELLRVLGPQTAPERKCQTCAKTVDAKFLFCPFCGSFKQDICTQCQMPMEKEWINCPSCGKQRA